MSRIARLVAIVLPAETQQQVLTEILIRAVVVNFLSRHRTIATFRLLCRPIVSDCLGSERYSNGDRNTGRVLSSTSKLIP